MARDTDSQIWGTPRANYGSCYVVDQTGVNEDGQILKIFIDLQLSYFQHAILMVSSLNDGQAWTETNTGNYLQNAEIYIGHNAYDYTKNTKCAGGPFFDVQDDSNYSFDQNFNNPN